MKTSLRICALLAVMITLGACSGQEPDIKSGVKNAFEKVKTYGQTLASGVGESVKATPADAVEGDKIAVVFDSGVNFEDHSFN